MSAVGLTTVTHLNFSPGFCVSLWLPVHQETGGLGRVDRLFPGDDSHLVAQSFEQFDDLRANKASASSHQNPPGAHLFPSQL